MVEQFKRTELLIGEEGIRQLQKAKVAVFGIGGVGGYAVEALARSGIGAFVLVDNDRVSLTNLNRQIIATHKTIGRYKTEVMKERILDINPDAQVEICNCFYLPGNASEFDFTGYSYVIDAVDTVTAKLGIIMQAKQSNVPVISCMGAGNKLDPSKFQVADIYKTSVCPLAKVMRHECRKRGIKKLKVVYSTEEPVCLHSSVKAEDKEDAKADCLTDGLGEESLAGKGSQRRSIPGSVAFVPSVAGMLLASEVVKDLIQNDITVIRKEGCLCQDQEDREEEDPAAEWEEAREAEAQEVREAEAREDPWEVRAEDLEHHRHHQGVDGGEAIGAEAAVDRDA